MYKILDISVIIPTYNRLDDLKETLYSFKNNINLLNEIIIVDQSTSKDIKHYILGLKNKKVRYIYQKVPSLTAARNLGVQKASKTSKIICFLDDDVTLSKGYFNEITRVFNEHPEAKGVSVYQKLPKFRIMSKFENFIKRSFLIGNLKSNSARALSVYGNEYPSELTRIIKSQWLSGFNMNYKKEVFKSQKFDENLKRYALAEDFDFSYRLWKKYPGSLFITPFAKINHRASMVERYPTAKISYMNQINHFYLNNKNFNSNFVEKCKFLWCLFGIMLLRTAKFMLGFKIQDWLKLKYSYSSLLYCLKNKKRIINGDLSFEL